MQNTQFAFPKNALFLFSTRPEKSENKKIKIKFSSCVNFGNHAEHAVRISQNELFLFSTRSENSKTKKIKKIFSSDVNLGNHV